MQISIHTFVLMLCDLSHGWHVQASAPMQSCQFAESVQASCTEKTDVQGSEETSLLQLKGGNKQADDTKANVRTLANAQLSLEKPHGRDIPRETSFLSWAHLSQDCCSTDTGSFLGMGAGTCADGTQGTPYCGVEECNAIGCECKGGCRKPAGWDLPAPSEPPLGVKPFPEETQHPSDIEYAWKLAMLSSQIYAFYKWGAEKEKAEMAVREIGYKVWWQSSEDVTDTTKKVIFVHDTAKRVVLTIRGTQTFGEKLKDGVSIGTFHIYPEEEVKEIKSLKEKIESDFPGYSILITGHSLGGYLAEIGATTFNLPGMVFCAPSPGDSHNGKARPENFQIINAWFDTLGNMDGWVFKEAHFKQPMFLKAMEEHDSSTIVRLLHDQVPELTNYEPWVQYVLHGQYQSYFTPYNDNPTSPNNWKNHVQ